MRKEHLTNFRRSFFIFIITGLFLLLASGSAYALEGNETIIELPNDISDPVSLTFQGIEFLDYLDTYKITFDNGDVIDSSASGNQFSKSSKELLINEIFPNVKMNYTANGRMLKQEIILDAKPYSSIKSEYVYFTSEIDFDDNYFLYANGQRQYGDFETSGVISIADETMARITIDKPFAIDSKGQRIDLSYSVEHNSIFGFFEHWYLTVKVPVEYLENANYPVMIDPTAISGCSESATEVLCAGGTFNGNYINTTKNITISSATINGLDVDGSKQGQVILTSSGGNITIISSTINAYGDNFGSSSQGLQGYFKVYGAPQGLYIISSTINSYGGSGSCTPGTGNSGAAGRFELDRVNGTITYDGSIINAYGGTGCAVGNGAGGSGGAGSYISASNSTLQVLNNGVIINAYGGPGATGGSSGSPTATGGTGNCYFGDRNIITPSNTAINITANCYGGSVSGIVGTRQGGDGYVKFLNNKLVNASFIIEANGACTGGPCTSGASRFEITNDNSIQTYDGLNNTRYIFRDLYLRSEGTGGSTGGWFRVVASEWTILNYTTISTNSKIFNASQDIFRYGVFYNNEVGATINYNQPFGAYVVNTTNPAMFTFNGGTQIYRNFSQYYYPMHKLDSPTNNSFGITGVRAFNVTHVSEYYTPANVTFYVWYTNGTLFNQTTVNAYGERNTTSLNINMTNNGQYLWNAFLTSTSNLRQAWYGISNYTFSVGATINNQSYNTSTYETATESFAINLTMGNTNITSGSLVYNSVSYPATLTLTGGSEAILNRTIDIPLGVGSLPFYWNIVYESGDNQNTPTFTQTVNPINLTICGAAPQNIPYINFSFYDESTLTSINASTDVAFFTYNIGGGTVNKTLLYQNSTQSASRAFCFNPPNRTVQSSVSYQYSATDYPQRTFTSTYDLTNVTTNQTLYLLGSADGIYVTFQYVTNLGTTLSGVDVSASRDVSGSQVVVGQGLTDSSGSITFWLNPNYVHTIIGSRSDCVASSFSVTPTQSAYTITMQCSGTQTYDTSPISGIVFQKSPNSGPIGLGTTTFRYSVFSTSENITLTKAKFELFRSNGTIININESLVSSNYTFCTSQQCNLTLVYTIQSGDDIKSRYFVDIGNGYVLLEGDAHWRAVVTPPNRTTSLKFVLQDIRSIFGDWDAPTCSFSDDGLEGTACTQDAVALQNKLEYSRLVFFFLIMAVVLAVLGKTTGYDGTNPGIFMWIIGIIIILGSLVGGISGEGFFYYSNLTGFHFLNNYILAFTMIMMMIGYWCMLNRRQT